MKTENRIAVACFIGAFIGLVIAFTIRHNFWWVGMLVGGLVGHLSYNVREVLETSRKVWRSLCTVRNVVTLLLGIGSVISSALTFMLLPLYLSSINLTFPSFLLLWVVLSVFFGFAFRDIRDREVFIEILKHANPISAPFWAVYWFIKGTAWCVERILTGMMFVCRFVKGVFILIHSDIRLLCGVDAALGVFIGRMMGQSVATNVPAILAIAVFGGIVGALLGVLNYRLVSIRWLKLSPVKA